MFNWNLYPYTNLHELNLDWIINIIKTLIDEQKRLTELVGTFDDRITANTNAITQINLTIENINNTIQQLTQTISENANLELQHYNELLGRIIELENRPAGGISLATIPVSNSAKTDEIELAIPEVQTATMTPINI